MNINTPLFFLKYLFGKPLTFFILATLLGINFSTKAFAECKSNEDATDQSLIFTIDISSSVDLNEQILQMKAYEYALSNQNVQDKLLGCGCTDISIIFFGSNSHIVERFKRFRVKNINDIESVVNFFSNKKENPLELYYNYKDIGLTDIFLALNTSINILQDPQNTSTRKAVLISGDGADSNAMIPNGNSKLEQFKNLRKNV